MNEQDNPIATLVWTFGLMSLLAVGGANSAIPEMHRIAVDVHHWMTDKQLPMCSRSRSSRRGRTC
jgi:chromate transporter